MVCERGVICQIWGNTIFLWHCLLEDKVVGRVGSLLWAKALEVLEAMNQAKKMGATFVIRVGFGYPY